MKKNYLLLPLILLLISCGEKKGFDLFIKNTIESDFTLLLDVTDENGSQLILLNIPVGSALKTQDFRYSSFNEFNFDFETVLVRAELFSNKNGGLIDSKIAMWPGIAGMSGSAGSNRITIELAIDKINSKVEVSFRSII